MLKYYVYLWFFFTTGIYLCSITKKDSPRIAIKDLNQLRQTIEEFKKDKSKARSSRTSSTTTTPHQLLSPLEKNNPSSSEENN